MNPGPKNWYDRLDEGPDSTAEDVWWPLGTACHAGPCGGGLRGSRDSGRDAAERGRSQALRPPIGVLHGGRGLRPREEIAARGDLDEARPLVERLETMGRELILGLEGLTLETQPRRAAEAGP
jgi:hypothetical protein